MRPVLFIDRDGVLLIEPADDYQIDTLKKFAFVPGVISALSSIRKRTDLHFAMVTNQDGLGTESYPEETFWPYHQLMLDTLRGEGVIFDAIHIDKTMPEENAPTRKPGTAMLRQYIEQDQIDYDLKNSFVIGDRLTDIQLAGNLGCRAIWFADPSRKGELTTAGIDNEDLSDRCALITDSWQEVESFIISQTTSRRVVIERKTKETDIRIELNLDGSGLSDISTGLKFFDHMLDQLARHSGCDLFIRVDGDLEVDEHHTIEDTALALGEAFLKALGDKRGISRYGFLLPMDDSLAQAAVDFSGRPWIIWEVEFTRDMVGDVPTEMLYHFFKSFSDQARCNLALKAQGDNSHHIAEALFKAFARAVGMAVKRDLDDKRLPTTKGSL